MEFKDAFFLPAILSHDFNDTRLNKRLHSSIGGIFAAASQSFPVIFKESARLKGFYRFASNKKTSHSSMMEISVQAMVNYINSLPQMETLYFIQDSSEVIEKGRKNHNHSYMRSKKDHGYMLHNGLVVSPDGQVLGLGHQEVIIRDLDDFGKKKDRKSKPIEEKESYKWITGLLKGAELTRQTGKRIIHLMDREGDIIDIMNKAWELDQGFLIRASYDRKLQGVDTKLWETLARSENHTIIEREISNDKGKKQIVKCRLAYHEVRPAKYKSDKPIFAVHLKSLEPVDGEMVEWMLYYSEPIKSFEDAERVIDGYGKRWMVEDFHKGLKSGCKLLERQFESDAIKHTVTAILSIVAAEILSLRNLARNAPDTPAEAVLKPEQLEVLAELGERYLKPTEKTDLTSGTVLWAIAILARLGGHQGIRQKGMPGWQTLWKGKEYFDIYYEGFAAAKRSNEANMEEKRCG